jgi:SsrA-binding protein
MAAPYDGRVAKKTAPRRKDDAAEPVKRVIATNRRARHDYAIQAVLEAGLMLTGSEVKSLRTNGATLQEGWARLEDGELWLVGMHIPPLPQASYFNHEPTRPRKCLVHRREIGKLEAALAGQGTTLVPLSLYFKGHRVKVELGVARGRAKGDKREAERAKEDRERMRSAMRR